MQLCVTLATYSENVVPPEEPLSKPPTDISTTEEALENPPAESSKGAEIVAPAPQWLVVAKNRRVNRDWELLLLRAPENARRLSVTNKGKPTEPVNSLQTKQL